MKTEKQENLILIAKILKKNNLTLAVSESCTGGLISHNITNLSGSSKFFLGGIIAYSNEIKINFLDIKEILIKKYGAVSKIVAKELASKIKEKFNSTFGIGVTGIAGPSGGNIKKPVGLVYIALVFKNFNLVKKYQFKGERLEIKEKAAFQTFKIFKEYLAYLKEKGCLK
ncbi:MAG: CinA family protein [Armatimonadetes bacterium]|nr:CinA family protein [Armatimonadota bacterium]